MLLLLWRLVIQLTKKGADVNKATTDDGTTPLIIAVCDGHVAVVKLLLAHGADANIRNVRTGAAQRARRTMPTETR